MTGRLRRDGCRRRCLRVVGSEVSCDDAADRVVDNPRWVLPAVGASDGSS
jgi:hypothetical protein